MNAKGIQKILQCSKAQLQEISCSDYDDAVHYFQNHEVRDVHMLVHYQHHLISTELFPEDAETFRVNSITRKDCMSFVNQTDAIALISSTGDTTTTPPNNNGI